MQYGTVSYTDGMFDEVGGSSLQLHLLELVERIEVGRGPVSEHRTSRGAHLFFTGNRRDQGEDIELVVSAALDGEPASQGHTVRLPRAAVDRRIQMNGGDPLMLIADYRRRHTAPVAAERAACAERSPTRQEHGRTPLRARSTGGTATARA